MRRIVFSLFSFRRCLPERFFSYSTQSKQTFYAKVRHRSFHTAWTRCGHGQRCDQDTGSKALICNSLVDGSKEGKGAEPRYLVSGENYVGSSRQAMLAGKCYSVAGLR